MKTKLRHFAHTTSPQFTALSRGKRLPLSASDSPPVSPSTLSPLVVSISLMKLKSQQSAAQSNVTSAPPQPSSMRKKRGRPSNKVRPTALSSFVMKKRASSPSTFSDSGSPCPVPPVKRLKVGSESESSTTGVKCSGEVDSSLLLHHNLHHSVDLMDVDDTCGRAGTPLQSAAQQRLEVVATQQNQGTVQGNTSDVCADDEGGGVGNNPCAPDDDQLSVTSSSTTSTTTTNHTSFLTTTTTKSRGKGKAKSSLTTNSNGVTKRGRPTKPNSCNDGSSLSNELQSLMSTSKSTFNFNKMFSFYPPKLVVKDGELVPERSLSVRGIDLTTLPENHPFLSWSLGQPVKGTVTLRRKKRKAPKAV